MMDAGLEDEVGRLVEMGFGWDLPAMSALGYAQFRPYFENQVPLEETVTEIKRATHRFIRRQYNWFRLNDPNIHWFMVSDRQHPEAVKVAVIEWLSPFEESSTQKGCLPRQEPVVE
jgi:tRNA A37 N6-isopentenylltransferase MiaA